MIVSTLFLVGSNVAAQKRAQLPRSGQKTEQIVYANERASVMPGYRGYRRSRVSKSSETTFKKTASQFARSSNSYRDPKPSFGIKPSSDAQVIKAIPASPGHAGRVTNLYLPNSGTEFLTSAPDVIEYPQQKSNLVKTRKPAKPSPDFRSQPVGNVEQIVRSSPAPQPEAAPVIAHSSRHITVTKIAAPVIPGSSRYITGRIKKVAVPVPVAEGQISTSSRRIAVTKTQAPEIPSSARRIAMTKVPVPAVQTSSPEAIVPAETPADVVKTGTPSNAWPTLSSPNLKDRIRSEYAHKDLQQSPWKHRPKQENRDKVAVSAPVERESLQPLQEIEFSDFFETVEKAFSADSITVAAPSKRARSGSEEDSPSTSSVAATVALPAAETEHTAFETESLTKPVVPVASGVAGLSSRANLPRKQKVRVSVGDETRRQKSAAGVLWYMHPMFVVPVVMLLGWALLGTVRRRKLERVPVRYTIYIPREKVAEKQNCNRSDGLHSETELLDEIRSINSIASVAQCSANSTSKSTAKA